jgi:hypothetical protein
MVALCMHALSVRSSEEFPKIVVKLSAISSVSTEIISSNDNITLVSVMEIHCVFCEIGTEF